MCGGYDGVSALSSAECYDPLRDSWHPVAPMLRARSAAAAAVIGEKIYVLGGHNGAQIESTVRLRSFTYLISMLRQKYFKIILNKKIIML